MNDIDSLLVNLLAIKVNSIEMALSNLNVEEYEAYVSRCAPDLKFAFEQYKSLESPSSDPGIADLYSQLKEAYYQQFHLE